MSHDVVNENVELGYYREQTKNYSELAIQILEAYSITTPTILKLDKHSG